MVLLGSRKVLQIDNQWMETRGLSVLNSGSRLLDRRLAAAYVAIGGVTVAGLAVGVVAVRRLPGGHWERIILHSTLGDPVTEGRLDRHLSDGWEVERRVIRQTLRSTQLTYYLRRRPRNGSVAAGRG